MRSFREKVVEETLPMRKSSSRMGISLEKEIEIALGQYEEERRKEDYLDLNIHLLKKQLSQYRPNKLNEKLQRLTLKRHTLQNKLDVYQKQLNTIQNENAILRAKIDHSRIAAYSHRAKIKSLEDEIRNNKKLMDIQASEQNREKEQGKDKLTELRAVMSKSASGKMRYTQKLNAINGVIIKEKFSKTMYMKMMNEKLDELLTKDRKIIEIIQILKKFKDLGVSRMKEKRLRINNEEAKNNKLRELYELACSQDKSMETHEFSDKFIDFYDNSCKLSKYLLEVLAEVESLECKNNYIINNLEEISSQSINSHEKAVKILQHLTGNLKIAFGHTNTSMKHYNCLQNHLKSAKIWLEKSAAFCESPMKRNSDFEDDFSAVESLLQSIKIFEIFSENSNFPIAHIIPLRKLESRDSIGNKLKEFLTDRDFIESFGDDEEVNPVDVGILRQRATILFENPQRIRMKTPQPRLI